MSTIRSLFTAALALALICIAVPNAGAQQLRTGDRIRVKTVSGELGQRIGLYHASEPDYLVLYTGESAQAKIPWDDISQLQFSRGEQSNAGKGALIGLAIGGGLGLALGIGAAADDSGWYDDVGAGEVALTTAMVGAFGAGVGALIGLASKSERWQTVPREQWQIQVAPDPKGGVALGLSLRM